MRFSHRASDCKSRNCLNCNSKHHTAICDQKNKKENKVPMMSVNENSVTYPILVVNINGVMCRALVDTGAGSSYISAGLINHLNLRAKRHENREIEMLLHTANKRISIYQVSIANISNNENILSTEVSKVDKDVLMYVSNPKYEKMISSYKHLEGVKMDDNDTKQDLPIHIILGNSDFTKIKTKEIPRVGNVGEPVAEFTKLGWMIMSPGHEPQPRMYLTQSLQDYDRLCNLDVLGVQEPENEETVFRDFKDQLTKRDNYYETGLLWKIGHPKLPSNKIGSLNRLSNLLRKLNRDQEKLKAYDDIIQDYISQGIVEIADENDVNENSPKQFYLPHRAVYKESAETTKLRIVFDGSSRENSKSPSLNECLETGPSLLNLLWNILVRNRFNPIAITGDLKQAFLQIRIAEKDRDVLRFHWVDGLETQNPVTFRFTRALFGLVQCPFLFGGTIDVHLDSEKVNPELTDVVEEISKTLYVDDLIMGGHDVEMLKTFKEKAIEIFEKAGFVLHKWHSNKAELEDISVQNSDESSTTTYAKQQLGGAKSNCTKILGLVWDKKEDSLQIHIPEVKVTQTKRGILKFISSIYDPTGVICPTTLLGKDIYRQVCELKLSWDQPLQGEILNRFNEFCNNLPRSISFPRSLITLCEKIKFVDLHVFSDASKVGTAAALYAIIYQDSGMSQGLVAAKARLSKKSTIPRLELVGCHMAANLLENIKGALGNIEIRNKYGWTDSTVALHWIRGGGNYKQFVSNRVNKIKEKSPDIIWRHVPGVLNPADRASRGCYTDKLNDDWWIGPEWLSDVTNWPEDFKTAATKDSESEAKILKEMFALAIPVESDSLYKILEKFPFWKTMRIFSWIARFIHNCRNTGSMRRKGPLTTDDILEQIDIWVKRDQSKYTNNKSFEEDKLRLNLQPDDKNILRCKGRIYGDYPIYMSTDSLLSRKMVMRSHLKTLHGGVGLMMSDVRENYWIPRLRQLCKTTIHNCFGCKRFLAIAYANPPVGPLPRDRTEGDRPFQVIGVDYAGPIRYKTARAKRKPAYYYFHVVLLVQCI